MRRLGRSWPVALVLVLSACTGASQGVQVQPIEDIQASEIAVEPDPSGTVATLRVDTTIPVVCAVVYGVDDAFGSIATDGSAIVRSFTVTIDGGETLGPFSTEGDDTIADLQAHGRQLRFEAVETTGGNTGAIEIEVYASES